MWPNGCSWASSTGCEIGCIDDESSHVGDAGHERDDHCPCEFGAVYSGWLTDNGSYTVCFNDRPDEEGDSGYGDADGLGGEEVSAGKRYELAILESGE